MRRDRRLRELSLDHYHALVLARFIDAMCIRDCLDEFAVPIVRERFEAEIVPHFLLVEMLLAALEERGADVIVARTRSEHATMLRLLEEARTTDPSSLRELAKLMAAHVRFEERELYPACEELLDDGVLEAVACARTSEPRA